MPHQTHTGLSMIKGKRSLRRNNHNIKSRHVTIAQQRPQSQVQFRSALTIEEDDPAVIVTSAPSDIPEKVEPTTSVSPLADTSFTIAKSSPASTSKKVKMRKKTSGEGSIPELAESTPARIGSPYGHGIKPALTSYPFMILVSVN